MIVSTPAPAFAWRQTQTCLVSEPPAPTATPWCRVDERPRGLHWPTPEVRYAVNEVGSDDFPTADGRIAPELLEAITASFETWNAVECSDFAFVQDGLTSAPEYDRDDGLNVVVFRDDAWPYGSMVLAVTTVSTDDDGIIYNADLELNGFEQNFAIGAADAWDVQNTITHEAGHMLGLDHDVIEGSTMEFEAALGEVAKRSLHPDDIEGLCAIYPRPDSPDPADPPPDDGCCRVVTSSPPPSSLTLFLAVLLVAPLRNRSNTARTSNPNRKKSDRAQPEPEEV